MSDSRIISIISSIHSKILIFFLSIFIFFIILFSILYHGIHIHELHLPSVKITELYIKWDEKLIISIGDASILSETSYARTKPFDLDNSLDALTKLLEISKRIDIKHLRFKDINTTIDYSENKNGTLKIDSRFLHLNSSITARKNTVYFHIDKLHYLPLKLEAEGEVKFEKQKKFVQVNLNTTVAKEAFFNLHASLHNGVINFFADFQKRIAHPKTILNLLYLPNTVHYWAVDAYETSGVEIKDFQGKIDLNNLKKSLTTIYAHAVAKDVVYRYNKQVAPVETTNVDLEFKNGILYIRPQNAQSYGFNLQKSYLTIDFAKQVEVLTLYLRFDHGKLDSNVLHILHTYHINVPLKQIDGETKTDLTLKIALRNVHVEAQGEFTLKRGKFHYLGNDIDVKNLSLHLDNRHLWAKNVEAEIAEDFLTSFDLDLYITQHLHGKIDFFVRRLTLQQYDLALTSKPHIVYYLNKTGTDTVNIPDISWTFKNTTFKTAQSKLTFDYKSKTLTIPALKTDMADIGTFFLSGNISFEKKNADIDLDLVKLRYKTIQLAQSDLYLHLIYNDETLHVATTKQTRVYIGAKEATLDKFEASFSKSHLTANNLTLSVKELFQSNCDLDYNFETNSGKLVFKYLKIDLPDGATLFESDKPLVFKVRTKEDFRLASQKFSVTTRLTRQGTLSLELLSLKKRLPYSPFLQSYKIKEGVLKLKSAHTGFSLQGKFTSEYGLLVQNDKIINKYRIVGHLGDKNVITVNKNIILTLDDKIVIHAKHLGLNIVEIEKIIDTINQKEKKNDIPLHLYLYTTDGYFYLSKARRILFDTFNLQTFGKETTAQLRYKRGNAGFRYKDKQFYLYGSGFGDDFMGHLFFLSKFKGGTLDFNFIGTFTDYKGIFEIRNTTILDYKILNNILAFIDTVPSLVTFSLPSYAKEGLKVSKAYASFHYHDDIFDFDNIKLNSTQIEIAGKGKASYTKDFIDLVLQLKTKLANKASKIPVVGYIIFDGESLSTTLKVSGTLEDPKVKTMLAKDIVVAPLNIIKRTLLLPAHLLGLDKDNNKTK